MNKCHVLLSLSLVTLSVCFSSCQELDQENNSNSYADGPESPFYNVRNPEKAKLSMRYNLDK